MDVATWYSSLPTKWLDVIGDFAGKDKFFVEGDSLLFHCFSDPRLDFNPGFQLLHATYLVEKNLADLKRRGAEFDVVFFDNHASYCVPPAANDPSKYLLARAAITKHLQIQTRVKIINFQDLADEEFDKALRESRWTFALCSDGGTQHASSKGGPLHAANSNKMPTFRLVIFRLAQKKLHIALLAGLTYQDSKVFAFVLDHKHHNLPAVDQLTKSVSSLTLSSTNSSAVGVSSQELESSPLLGSSRLGLISNALTSDLLAESEPRYKIAALLQAVYLEVLPITHRHFESVAFSDKDEQQWHHFSSLLNKVLLDSLAQTKAPINVDFPVVDLLDGRLLRLIISDLHKAWDGLALEWAEKISLTMSHIGVQDVGVTNQILFRVVKRATNTGAIIEQGPTAVLPFSNLIFDRHLSGLALAEKSNRGHALTSASAVDDAAWSTPPSKRVGPKALRPHDGKAYQIMLRRQQRAFTHLTVYAQSLAGGKYDPRLIVVAKPAKGKATKKNERESAGPKKSKKAQELIEANKKRLEAKKPTKKASSKATAAPAHKGVIDQLQYDGPLLKRDQAAQDDTRVAFKPDPWQVKVLDELDDGNSLLLVAPTSSGKTFVSFYAMEKVLRASDDDVLVYVAPTKALVNQIAAEVMGKFKKNYQGKTTRTISLVSIYTRDLKVNHPTKSQILVTLPGTLQSLLLNPANKDWAPRIKTIIFDEVHSMASAEDSLLWEQLIVGSSCQIVALSATVGNLSAFSKWLSSTRATSGKQLKLILHDQRWADLRKYIYEAPNATETSSGPLPKRPENPGTGLDDLRCMTCIHPAASLLNAKNAALNDLDLESRDCLMLWRSLKQFETTSFKVPDSLSPDNFFSSAEIIKDDVLRWGKRLKLVLKKWMTDTGSPFTQVQKALSVNLSQLPRGDSEAVMNATVPLLRDLRGNGSLPAIVFNFNRKECEDIAVHLLKQLEEVEAQHKSTSASWKRKLDKFVLWKAMKTKSQTEVKKKTKGDHDKVGQDDQGRDESTSDEVWQYFDPDAPLDDYSFADIAKSDARLLESTLQDFGRAGIPSGLIRAFGRGIGVHHSGMNKRYRHAVEIFFRQGFLTVVIATGTLSLGINMPAKTVVFAGDSVHLTALNYRQSSGRAGRRGFDLLGNVVFQNVSTDRVLRLMSSELPEIKGHFTMTTTFVLRLLNLLHHTGNAPYAVEMVDALLSRTHLYQQGDQFKQQVLCHVRFSIEYLRTQGLLDAEGKPSGLAPLVRALHVDEKGAFSFHALLRQGYFFDLARQYEKAQNSSVLLEKLMFVLSHLFSRRPVRRTEKEDDEQFRLKPLPESAAIILCRHNEEVLNVFKNYAASYGERHGRKTDAILPLSQVEFESASGANVGLSSLTAASAPSIRSPFVALSGHGDSFNSINDLCETIRGDVFLETSALPYLEHLESSSMQLNSYLCDFVRNGSVKDLIDRNHIPPSDVWFVLNDFSTTLSTIVTTLESMVLGNEERGEDEFDSDGKYHDNDFEEQKDGSEDNEEEWDSEDPTIVSSDESDEAGQNSDLTHDMQALLAMFRGLQEVYEEKFHKMWA